MNIIEEFVDWFGNAEGDVVCVQNMLSSMLSDEPEALIKDLEKAEVWNARMGYLLAIANSFLDKAKQELMRPKEGMTEFERKVSLDASVSPIREKRDWIEALCDTIKQRLILGESILSYAKQFNDHRSQGVTNPKLYA